MIGVLASGGLDSAILISHLLDKGERVQPFYIRSNLFWEGAELAGLQAYRAAVATGNLLSLVELQLPLDDLYSGHWSISGNRTPDATTPDEAVYLPGRNLLLIIKAALWCQLHGIDRLALGVLASNPFEDATPEFFSAVERVLSRIGQPPLRLELPFAKLHKRDVMEIGPRLSVRINVFVHRADRRAALRPVQQMCGAPGRVSDNRFTRPYSIRRRSCSESPAKLISATATAC